MAWHTETIVIAGVESGFEHEIEAEFEVLWHRGCPESWDDPGEAAHGEVTNVKAKVRADLGDDTWVELGREHWAERVVWDAVQDHVHGNPSTYKPGEYE